MPRHVAGSIPLSVTGPPDMSPGPGRMRGCSCGGWKLLALEPESRSLEGQSLESCLGRGSSSWMLTLNASPHAVGTLVGAPSPSTARTACVSHTHTQVCQLASDQPDPEAQMDMWTRVSGSCTCSGQNWWPQ